MALNQVISHITWLEEAEGILFNFKSNQFTYLSTRQVQTILYCRNVFYNLTMLFCQLDISATVLILLGWVTTEVTEEKTEALGCTKETVKKTQKLLGAQMRQCKQTRKVSRFSFTPLIIRSPEIRSKRSMTKNSRWILLEVFTLCIFVKIM